MKNERYDIIRVLSGRVRQPVDGYGGRDGWFIIVRLEHIYRSFSLHIHLYPYTPPYILSRCFE